jgi:hypothetical protein
MKTFFAPSGLLRLAVVALGLQLLSLRGAAAGPASGLVGRWTLDEGFQVVEFLFRSDGRYQIDTRSTDPAFDFAFTDRGRYTLAGDLLGLAPYEFFGEPGLRSYAVQQTDDALFLTRTDLGLTQEYRFRPGSTAEVLAREQVEADLIGTWRRTITFAGTEAYTFRPGGYYAIERVTPDSPFPPESIRGRYELGGDRLTLRPYGGVATTVEIDFFGTTLTLIEAGEFSGSSRSYEAIPGSGPDVRAKAAEAEAFLARPDWLVGTWEVRDAVRSVDVTFRPDGRYAARHDTEFSRGLVRGRYTLEPRRIQLAPFVGQDLYARSNGEFGKAGYARDLDYYDGELLFVDPAGFSQAVVVGRKVPGSEVEVVRKTREALAERARPGWLTGRWEVNDPTGWMEFTWRPDGRYLAMAGADRVAGEVERGRHVLAGDKLTLAPHAGLGAARGFEIDLFDGDLFLAGDLHRLVVARKVPGSEAEVAEKALHPVSLLGERGGILGRWTANRPGESVALTFRPDGQFRLDRCAGGVVSRDYGLYSADVGRRTVVVDSRLAPVRHQELDFYGDTLTIHGGDSAAASTYRVNLGQVDAAIADSHAADAEREAVDAQWLDRVPIRQRDPQATPVPAGDLPADPRPERVLDSPTVLQNYRLYRRLVPGFVYFNDLGTIRSVAVVHTREWHFFPNGRVLVRFTNYRAGPFYPQTVKDVSLNWGAYRLDPPSGGSDILHLYADDEVLIDSDLGEQASLTLEDGRRQLFWGKDYLILSEWASEQVPTPCEQPAGADPTLLNTGVNLATSIPPDPVEAPASLPILTGIRRLASGRLEVAGTAATAGVVVVEESASLGAPVSWVPRQTNTVPAGDFVLEIPGNLGITGFFRLTRR